MKIEQATIRTPERWLKCSGCGAIVDVTPAQYFGDEPAPDWFTQGRFDDSPFTDKGAKT